MNTTFWKKDFLSGGGIDLYRFFSQLKSIYQKQDAVPFEPERTPFSCSLEANLSYIRTAFSDSADLTVRELKLSGLNIAVISIDNMVDKQVLSDGVIKPMFGFDFTGTPQTCYNNIKYRLLYTPDLLDLTCYEEMESRIMSGFAVIAVDGCDKMLAVGIQGYASRSVSEPEADVVQRGSKEGFVESLRVNMSMLRRRMKNPLLVLEVMTVGSVSRTEVGICYLRDKASPAILEQLRSRLRKTGLKTLMASGYLVPFLEEQHSFSLFSGVGTSERPDTVCGKLTEGRIAVIVDGVPSVLIVPYLFAEHFQTLDDYSNRSYFAALTRRLKYAAFLISVLLPGVYVTLGTFDPEMFPTLMLNKIASSITATPLSLLAETILILFVYEIMREAGLRMPQPLGYAVSIVGGLVVGDTAVNAGLLGAPTLMVVAVTAISSYVLPDLYAPSAILRVLFVFAGGWFGMWGIAVLACVILINLCGKTSFGIPYTTPVTPFSAVALRDVFVRAGWPVLSKKTETVQELPGADLKEAGYDDEP